MTVTDETAVSTDEIDPFDADDPFDSPAPGAKFPTVAQLKDRLCILEPTKYEDAVPDRFNPGQSKPRMTVTVTFLDGDAITHHVDKDGEATELPEPIEPGTAMVGMYISQTKLVSQLKGRKMVLGRIYQMPKIAGSTNSRAWAITDVPSLRKADDAKVAAKAKADYTKALRHIQTRSPFEE